MKYLVTTLMATILSALLTPTPAMAWTANECANTGYASPDCAKYKPTPPVPVVTPAPGSIGPVGPAGPAGPDSSISQKQQQKQQQGQSIGNTSVITLAPVQPGPCGPGIGVIGGGGNNGWALGGGITWPIGPKPNNCYPLPSPVTNVYVTNPAPQVVYRTTTKASLRKCLPVSEVYAGTGRTVKEDVGLMLSPNAQQHTHQQFWDAMSRLVKACVKDP